MVLMKKQTEHSGVSKKETQIINWSLTIEGRQPNGKKGAGTTGNPHAEKYI
jgi:hypothetical protein